MLDTELAARRGIDLCAAARAIVEGGARVLQLRHKQHFSRDLFRTAEEIAAACRVAGAQFVINDRADIALMLGAALHIGQDDLPPTAARRVMGEAGWIGFSTHNEEQLRAALGEPVDYVALGPMFETRSKLNPDPVVGVAELRRLRPLTRKPLVAIGGITRATAREVIEAGADSVAIIADLFAQDCTAMALRARAQEWVQLLER